MRSVRLYVDEARPGLPQGDAIIELHVDEHIFPHKGFVDQAGDLIVWARNLYEYYKYNEDYAILPTLGYNFIMIIREHDSHVMRFAYGPQADAQDLEKAATLHTFGVDLDNFTHQLLTEIRRLRGVFHPATPVDHVLASLGAQLRLNDDPVHVTPAPAANLLPRLIPVQVVVDWSSADVSSEPSRFGTAYALVNMQFQFGNEGVVFPYLGWRGEAVRFLEEACRELWRFWHDDFADDRDRADIFFRPTTINEFSDTTAEIPIHLFALHRDVDWHGVYAELEWHVLPEDVPPYAELTEPDGADGASREDAGDEYAVSRLVTAVRHVAFVDALDITRQIMEAARTLLALLDARGLASRNTRRMARQLDDLQRLLAPLLGDDGGSAGQGQ